MSKERTEEIKIIKKDIHQLQQTVSNLQNHVLKLFKIEEERLIRKSK